MDIRKLKKYCLLSILFAAYVGSCVGIFSSIYLEVHRTSFQSTISQSLQASIEKLVFSEKEFSEIRWEEKFKEFEFDGKLFDVSKIERTKEGFEIYCVNDSEEENIVALFKEWKKPNLPVSKTRMQLQPLFYSYSPIEMGCSDQSERLAFSEQRNNYISEQLQIPSPPPR